MPNKDRLVLSDDWLAGIVFNPLKRQPVSTLQHQHPATAQPAQGVVSAMGEPRAGTRSRRSLRRCSKKNFLSASEIYKLIVAALTFPSFTRGWEETANRWAT